MSHCLYEPLNFAEIHLQVSACQHLTAGSPVISNHLSGKDRVTFSGVCREAHNICQDIVVSAHHLLGLMWKLLPTNSLTTKAGSLWHVQDRVLDGWVDCYTGKSGNGFRPWLGREEEEIGSYELISGLSSFGLDWKHTAVNSKTLVDVVSGLQFTTPQQGQGISLCLRLSLAHVHMGVLLCMHAHVHFKFLGIH